MEDSARVKKYHRTRRVMSVAGFVLDFAVLVILLFTGWTIALRAAAERVGTEPFITVLVYLVLFGLIMKAVGLPLDYAQGFWLEHRYGLSNQTLGKWAWDQLKGLAVGGVLSIIALEFLYWTLRRWPGSWWMIAGVVFIGFFVLLANLAPILIFPLFYKFKPLENPSLVQKLVELCRRAGRRVHGVFEWKLSEKTRKANAALVGLGNTRRIILADTLLNGFTEDEVESVLAHELGHHVRRHILQGIAVQTAATFLGFYLVNWSLWRFGARFGFRSLGDCANLPLIVLVATVLSLVLLPAVNAHSRRMERQADAYALESIADQRVYVSALHKLAELNLAERRPHPWIEFIFYSHPSIEKRIAFAERFQAASPQQPGT